MVLKVIAVGSVKSVTFMLQPLEPLKQKKYHDPEVAKGKIDIQR